MPLEPHLDLRRQSMTADVCGRYYTSSQVSKTLIDAMAGVRPKLVVELGAGHGALVNAASHKWAKARYVTVDTDRTAVAFLDGLKSRAIHTHHIHDVLDDELADRIGISLESVDVGLCNPPYVRPRWKSNFGRILEDAGLSGALQSIHDAGADLLFIAQNLRLLKHRGKLGLILPDGLITGEKYHGVRSALLRQHLVEQVVQLPRRIFSRTDAQTYLLVLSKRCGETHSVALRCMNANTSLSDPIYIPADVARARLDYAFHSVLKTRTSRCSTQPGGVKVGDLVNEIFRGSISSNQIRLSTLPVFHLGDFPDAGKSDACVNVPARFIQAQHKSTSLSTSPKFAKAGDILIARIGRNLHEKVCILEHGTCLISDCVFVLRTARENRGLLLAYLLSDQGRQALAAVSHGVGAKYLSRADVLSMVLPV